MKRVRNHVIEDLSEKIMTSFLPDEWIIRKINKDYGIDYEIEIVNDEFVSGNRIWIQLKGKEIIHIRTKELIDPSGEKIEKNYISYSLSVDYIQYILSCGFPVLLFVVDITGEQCYWLPIQNDITERLQNENENWRAQKTISLKIPISNSLKNEKNSNYSGLRWFALEPHRLASLAHINHYLNDLLYRVLLTGYEIGEGYIDNNEASILLDSLKQTKKFLEFISNYNYIFGKHGIEIFIMCFKPQIIDAISSCDKLILDIPQEKISFKTTSDELVKVNMAIQTLKNLTSFYMENKIKFLFYDFKEV